MIDKDKKENASDEQLEQVSGGHHHDRFRDDYGRWREGEWDGMYYHDGYRGRWEGGVWINL